jgi:hypothetical protein
MDGLVNIMLSEVSQVQKDKVICFLSHVGSMQNMLPKVGLLEKTKAGVKEEKNNYRVNNIEIHHI